MCFWDQVQCVWLCLPADHSELHAQVPAQVAYCQGGRKQRFRLQEHSVLHSCLPRDVLHLCDLLPEPQGILVNFYTTGPQLVMLQMNTMIHTWQKEYPTSCLNERSGTLILNRRGCRASTARNAKPYLRHMLNVLHAFNYGKPNMGVICAIYWTESP